jgi:hypothetical protein
LKALNRKAKLGVSIGNEINHVIMHLRLLPKWEGPAVVGVVIEDYQII